MSGIGKRMSPRLARYEDAVFFLTHVLAQLHESIAHQLNVGLFNLARKLAILIRILVRQEERVAILGFLART